MNESFKILPHHFVLYLMDRNLDLELEGYNDSHNAEMQAMKSLIDSLSPQVIIEFITSPQKGFCNKCPRISMDCTSVVSAEEELKSYIEEEFFYGRIPLTASVLQKKYDRNSINQLHSKMASIANRIKR